MGPNFQTGQNDTGITFTDTITDINGNVVNLSGCTVKFVAGHMPPNSPVINGSATITNAATGQVSYIPTATDTANAGTYYCWWRVTTTGSGAVVDYPVGSYKTLLIEANDF